MSESVSQAETARFETPAGRQRSRTGAADAQGTKAMLLVNASELSLA